MVASATQTASGGSFQSGIAAQSAQIAALLDQTDSSPGETLTALASNAMGAIDGVSASPDPCFSPILYYANDPEAATYRFAVTGQWSPGDFSIWSPTRLIRNPGLLCRGIQLPPFVGPGPNAVCLGPGC